MSGSPLKKKRIATEVSENAPSDDEEELNFSDEEGTNIDGIYIPPPIKPACTLNTSGPRLIITKITNNFFKSYAENETLGPFHKCFNAIVGPNGSGKSNVIDSMLFVFGYRATKIRCKKVSVLLHNSENHRSVESATVEVHFAQIIDKEGDLYEIIPNSEFVVSRTALKDNTSYYMLNGNKVQFKDVGILLKKHGIDLDHNRFLILQGEVEQIAMMKCKGENPHEPGMLEYLEDIVGTSRYIKPLGQLHERVEVLTDARSEKVNRLKLVQNELEELKGPMEEAVEFLKAENTVVICKNIVYQKNIFDLEDNLKNFEEDKKVIQEAKDEIESKMEELKKTKDETEKKLETESQKYNSLTKRKNTMKDAFEAASKKDVELQAEMVQVNKNRKKTKELLEQERKKLIQYEKSPEDSEKGIEECAKKEEEMSRKKEKLEAEKVDLLAEIKIETRPLQEKKEVLETELVGLKKIVDETKSAYTLAESELKILMSMEESEREKYESIKLAYENVESTLKERKQQVNTLKNKIPLTEKSLRGAIDELEGIKEKEGRVRGSINSKRAELEEKRSSMQACKSRSKVLEALTQQKREGECPGLFGRLGDLGAIDKKYDVAVSTACGPLDNIVVDTVATAQWCIEFLKRNDVGRATFIALEKQEHLRQQANARMQTPENVPRLYDLIKVQDERVKTAFYFALRDTLVAKDLEQASRIAYGATRHRVVSLGGDLIETTGTMSGGGKRVLSGRMGQSLASVVADPRELENLEVEVEEEEKMFRTLRDQQVRLENQINVLDPELRQMKIDYEKYSIELQSLTQQQPALSKQMKTQEARAKSTKSDQVQVKKLSEVVKIKKIAYDEASEAAQEIQVQVDRLTEELMAKSIGRIKKMDKEINDVTKGIAKLKAEITRLKVAAKTAERNATKSAEKISTMEQDIKNCEERLINMKNQRDEIEEDGEKLLKCIEELESELLNIESDFSETKKEVDDLKKKLNKLKSEGVDVDQRMKTVKYKINQVNSSMHQWNVKISQLKIQEIPDNQLEELKKYTKEELEAKNMETVERDLKLAEDKLKASKPNLNAIVEYRKKQDLHIERTKELDEISQKRQEMKSLFDKLREQRKLEFKTGYEIIRMKLKEMYQMITLGGDADFELVDTFDPFTEGIQFNVRPPKKSWKKISNLSGGEKTLSSLALVFALHYYKPSPLYVMDEIDAALDFKNVSIVGHYIKERTKNAQFVIISLRSQMFELCDNLIGIYKTCNTTKSISIDPRVYDEEGEEQQQTQATTTTNEPEKDKETVENINNTDDNGEEEEDINMSVVERSESDEQIIQDSFEGDSMEM